MQQKLANTGCVPSTPQARNAVCIIQTLDAIRISDVLPTGSIFDNDQQRTSHGCTHNYSPTLFRDYEAPRDGNCNDLKGGRLPLHLWAVAEMLPYIALLPVINTNMLMI